VSVFGRKVIEFIRLPSTRDFVKLLQESDFERCENPTIATKGLYGSTWAHPDIAMECARWLDPKFASGVTGSFIRTVLAKKAISPPLAPVLVTFQPPANYPEALRALANSEEQKILLEDKARVDAPKVECYDAIMDSHGTFTWNQVAKILKKQPNLMLAWMRENNILMKERKNKNVPRQNRMGTKSPFFKVTTTSYTHPVTEVEHSSSTTTVYPEGVELLRRVFRDANLDSKMPPIRPRMKLELPFAHRPKLPPGAGMRLVA
jgi:phage antirepressor YoqD-like protein